jgi:hypothetical protein
VPNYTIPLEGGGEIHQNGATYADAVANAQAAGAQPSHSAVEGANQPTGGGGGGGGGGQGANLNAAQLLLNQAQQAAYQAYLDARLNLETDQFAFQKAQQAFTNTITEASLTGTYQGHQTQAAQEQAFRQGFDVQQEQNKTALGYLDLTSKLRGPNDPFQYLRTLSGTPQGITDVVNAAWGRYQLGGAPSGEQSAPATVAGQVANLNAATGGGGAAPGTSYDALMAAMPRLPGANQVAPQQYNQMNPSQRAALWAAYEAGLGPSGAMRPEDAQAAYLRSLPKYTLSGVGAIQR